MKHNERTREDDIVSFYGDLIARCHPARPSGLAVALALLTHAELPQEGAASVLSTTVVARKASLVMGCAAFEVYANVALLRSVAVDPTYRSRGLGQQLVEAQLKKHESRISGMCIY